MTGGDWHQSGDVFPTGHEAVVSGCKVSGGGLIHVGTRSRPSTSDQRCSSALGEWRFPGCDDAVAVDRDVAGFVEGVATECAGEHRDSFELQSLLVGEFAAELNVGGDDQVDWQDAATGS